MIKPITVALIVLISLAVVVVLPFVLLHWALGLGLIPSILVTWVWANLFLFILLSRDLNKSPDEEDDA